MFSEPFVLPMGGYSVNWQVYLQEMRRLIGRVPNKSVDNATIKLTDLAKYTVSLAEFQSEDNNDAAGALARPGPWLRHTFYSFLISTSDQVALYIAESTDLDVLSNTFEDERILIVSGNLQVWKEAVAICLDQHAPRKVRELFTIIRSIFSKLGFDLLWSDYRKKSMPDQTYYLEYKPK